MRGGICIINDAAFSVIPRNQILLASLECAISQDNSVRFIDAFTDDIDLKALGFENDKK